MISEVTSTLDDLSTLPAFQTEHFEMMVVDVLMLGMTDLRQRR
jgi:hypothetical protein